jgi:hypothetical protein
MSHFVFAPIGPVLNPLGEEKGIAHLYIVVEQDGIEKHATPANISHDEAAGKARGSVRGPSMIANRFHSPTGLQPRDQAPESFLPRGETRRT